MRRYDGNTGRYIHVPDEVIPSQNSDRREHSPQEATPPREAPAPELPRYKKATPPPNQLGSGLQNILSNIFAQGFEVEDLLLFAVLFLMYQETKDKELLIIMGGMFLL